MIVLLAADRDDALRSRSTLPDERIVWVIQPSDVRADVIEPSSRVVRTNRWQYDERVVSALQTLHARIGLVDPTGLLGPQVYGIGKRNEPYGTAPVGASFEADSGQIARRRRAGGA